MILLLDLDGTLVNTAHPDYKQMKDGLTETIINKIPVFEGAKEFVKFQKLIGNLPIIVSDSHPKYVRKIAVEIFDVDYVSLTDKPNPQKTLAFLESKEELKRAFHQDRDNFLVVGDSYLDIELGRRLNARTVLTKFYKASHVEERDGIGQSLKPVKSGPTYFANSFDELNEIIKNPIGNLLSIESIFQGGNSFKATKFKFQRYQNGFMAFRCLARQNDGECDSYARADKYFQIDNPNRTPEFISSLSSGIQNYLDHVLTFPEYTWDYFTYVSDKKTTSPPNKMKEIFDLVNCSVPKIKMFEWKEDVEGSLRNRPDYRTRRDFIAKYLYMKEGIDVRGKNIIIVDDQFTSSATAHEIASQLRTNGAKNVLFIAMFYLILSIESKECPSCGKPLKIKIRKSDGNKFYSCVPPKFRGEGCGLMMNID